MSENIYSQFTTIKNSKINSFIEFLKKECVLIVSLLLAFVSCFIATPKLSYIDFKVLVLLFNLMIIVAAFNDLNVLDSVAIKLLKKCKSYTSISAALIFMTFISAMIVTNDVALLTFVPLSIVIAKKANLDILKIVIFQTLAANLGSSFTPMGNPQNLFIYSFYNLIPIDFFKITAPILFLSTILLLVLIIKDKRINLSVDLDKIEVGNKNHIIIFSILFAVILLSVFHIVDYKLTFLLIIIVVMLLNNKLFNKVDYSLLITFVAFFIFVGNISTLDSVKAFMESLLHSSKSTFVYSILSSQVISNVPSTMLLSGFTVHFKELLLGVNIGGMGTLIASLASVISYKIYTSEFNKDNNRYIKIFTFYNVLGILIITPLIYFFVI